MQKHYTKSDVKVGTLNGIGQRPGLTASAIYHSIDILFIQEHRYVYCKDIKYYDTSNGWTFLTESAWKNSVNTAIGGVDMCIGPRALEFKIASGKYENDGSYI